LIACKYLVLAVDERGFKGMGAIVPVSTLLAWRDAHKNVFKIFYAFSPDHV